MIAKPIYDFDDCNDWEVLADGTKVGHALHYTNGVMAWAEGNKWGTFYKIGNFMDMKDKTYGDMCREYDEKGRGAKCLMAVKLKLKDEQEKNDDKKA